MVFEPIKTHSNSPHDSSEVKHFTVWAEDRLLNHHRKWPGDGGSTALRRAATKLGGVETFANKTMAKAARAAKARLFQVLDSHVQTIQETAQVSHFCRFSILCFFCPIFDLVVGWFMRLMVLLQMLDEPNVGSLQKVDWADVLKLGEEVSKQACVGWSWILHALLLFFIFIFF